MLRLMISNCKDNQFFYTSDHFKQKNNGYFQIFRTLLMHHKKILAQSLIDIEAMAFSY